MKSYEALLETAWSLDIIDTHEHLPLEEIWSKEENDVLAAYLRHYFSSDLVSAGLSPADLEIVRDSNKPLMERWKLAEPFWHAARSTGYGRALDRAAKDLYGLDGITAETLEPLNEQFLAARKATADGTKSHYQYVLKDKSKIEVSILDGLEESDLPIPLEFFRPVMRLDWFTRPDTLFGIWDAGKQVGLGVHGLDDWKAVIAAKLDEMIEKHKIVALKSGVAYSRSLRFKKVPAHVADEQFCAILAWDDPDAWSPSPAKHFIELQDHLMHHILKLADERGLTFQIHTGLQEGNGNHVANSNPELMTNVFLEYPNVKFDVFHMGYPYQQTLSAIGKNFPNVFIDMCWAHVISPEASVRAIVEWLDAVPANKICAFGGDYCFVDGVYGHAAIARENVAKALAIKIADGCFDLDRAKEIMTWMFVDTPKRLFHL